VSKENIFPIAIEDSMRRAFIDYSISVIIGRALPDVRDGLKPVHRRILYAMNEMGLAHNRAYKKSARLVGEVLGKYHPHGDSSVYDAMVRMTQSFSLRYPLVDGQGNFGSVDGDPAAAMRYTETRMTPLAAEMLTDIEKNTVSWKSNFDDTLEEPEVLPSRIPNLLLNGSSGIAVGMATNIPPHNFREIAEGIRMLIDDPETSIDQLMTVIQGPDFPTGGIICGRAGIHRAYKTGHGAVIMRCRAEVDTFKENRECIRITEIPFQVNKSTLLKQIARLVNNKEITGISDLRDESDKEGMRIVIELKRGEIAQIVLNQLYKHTPLQTSFNCNMLAIDGGRPRVMNLKEMLTSWIDHRLEVIRSAVIFDLEKAKKRAHILEGFKIALANIDRVVEIIKRSSNRREAAGALERELSLTETQANAILDMRLYQLTALESEKIESEYRDLLNKIEYLESLLADESRIYGIIREETLELAHKFGDDRRSSIESAESDFVAEDLIADEPCIITLTHTGYIKRVPTSTFRSQKRGGRGITGMSTRDEDFVEHLYSAMTHDTILVFTSTGMLHWLKVYAIPEGSRTSKGNSVANLLNISPEEKIASMITVREFDDERSIVLCTRSGTVKKTSLSLFSNIRKKGIIAMNVRENDRLIGAEISHGKDDIFLTTQMGYSIRFSESRVSRMGRTAAGVRGISLRKGDAVVGMDILGARDGTLLVVCENGYGKRTAFSEFRVTGRAGKGIITIKTSRRNGLIVSALAAKEGDDVMLISSSGMMVRIPVESISVQGRNTQGVRVVNLKENDKVVSMATVVSENADVEEAEGPGEE
jgi:DNA gyrase subunit A